MANSAIRKAAVDLVSDETLTAAELKEIVNSLQDCRFRPLLKLGMSKDEVHDAIDGAMDVFLECLTTKLAR